MRWCYYLDESDRDQHGIWTPRLVFADGMVTRSSRSITGLESLEDVRKEIAQWNWWAGNSSQDATEVIDLAKQHNTTLTEEEYWKKRDAQ